MEDPIDDQKPVTNPTPPASAAGTPYLLIASMLFSLSGLIWAALTGYNLVIRRGTNGLLYGGLAVLFLSLGVLYYSLFRQSQKGNP